MNIGIKNNTNIKVEKRVSIIDRTLRRLQENWRSIVIIIPFVWLLMFFLFPFFIVAKISLAEMKIASPPFTSMVEWADGGIVTIRIVFDNFLYIINDSLYIVFTFIFFYLVRIRLIAPIHIIWKFRK